MKESSLTLQHNLPLENVICNEAKNQQHHQQCEDIVRVLVSLHVDFLQELRRISMQLDKIRELIFQNVDRLSAFALTCSDSTSHCIRAVCDCRREHRQVPRGHTSNSWWKSPSEDTMASLGPSRQSRRTSSRAQRARAPRRCRSVEWIKRKYLMNF